MGGKIDKKKNKIIERIKFLEDELLMSLTKKTSNVKEISVSSHQRKIQELKIELNKCWFIPSDLYSVERIVGTGRFDPYNQYFKKN